MSETTLPSHSVGETIRWKFNAKWGRGVVNSIFPGMRGGFVYHCIRDDDISCIVPEENVVEEEHATNQVQEV